MIRHAELLNNLYIFLGTPHSSLCNNVSFQVNVVNKMMHNSFNLWHFRLGHISTAILQDLCTSFPYVVTNKNFICDSCHLAKQSRVSFPHSMTTSSKSFDLVHMDIWGPLSIKSFQGHRYFFYYYR